MPEFANVEVSTTIDVEFEVFCGTCGNGLCSESSTRRSRGRGYLQVEVNVCPDCMKEKEEEIENLKYEIQQLEEKLEQLENQES